MPTNDVQTIKAHLNLDGHRIGALGAPQSENEAATKGYVDGGLDALRQEVSDLRALIESLTTNS